MSKLATIAGSLLLASTAALGLFAVAYGGLLMVRSAIPVEGSSAPRAAISSTAGSPAAKAPSAVPSAPATSTAASAGEDPGAAVFGKCKACHSVKADGRSGVGPNLHGVVGRVAGSLEGYKFSPALSDSDRTWTEAALDAFLASPKTELPGNKMAFAGLKSADDRAAVIAYLAGTTQPAAGTAATADAPQAAPDVPADAGAPDPVAALPAPVDPPGPDAAAVQREAEAVAALRQAVASLDYERAVYHPMHFRPAIEAATDGECLVCHAEVLEKDVRATAPAGVDAQASLAWYQTLATYDGPQMTFHQRHLTSDFAQATMNLSCNFCHQGHDPREESPMMVPAAGPEAQAAAPAFTNRKVVDPSTTCLKCHGAFPDPVAIMGLPGPWHEVRGDFESEDQPNGCLSCHGEMFRTNRHRVDYLNAGTIEDLATASSDVCLGCHGGRSWYRISYPYPRNPWPGMDPAVPDWAVGRPTASDPRHALSPGAP